MAVTPTGNSSEQVLRPSEEVQTGQLQSQSPATPAADAQAPLVDPSAARDAAATIQGSPTETRQAGMTRPSAQGAGTSQSGPHPLANALVAAGIIEPAAAAGAVQAGRLSDAGRAALADYFAAHPDRYADFFATLPAAAARTLPQPSVVAARGAEAAALFRRASIPVDGLLAWLAPAAPPAAPPGALTGAAAAASYFGRPEIQALGLDVTGQTPLTDEQVDALLMAVGPDDLSHFINEVLLAEDSGVTLWLAPDQLVVLAMGAAVANVTPEAFGGLIAHIEDPEDRMILQMAYQAGQETMTEEAEAYSVTTRMFVLDPAFASIGIDLTGQTPMRTEQVQSMLAVVAADLPTFIEKVLLAPDSGVTFNIGNEGLIAIAEAAGAQRMTEAQLTGLFGAASDAQVQNAMKAAWARGVENAPPPAAPQEPLNIGAEQLRALGIDPTGQQPLTMDQLQRLVELIGPEKVTPFIEQVLLDESSDVTLWLDDEMLASFALMGGATGMSAASMRKLQSYASAEGQPIVEAMFKQGQLAAQQGTNPVTSE